MQKTKWTINNNINLKLTIKMRKLLLMSCFLASMLSPMLAQTNNEVVYDFTDTSVWGAQTIVSTSEATAYTYSADGKEAESGVTFHFAATAKVKWSSGVYFTGAKVDATSSINYVKVSVPAGYAADVTGKGANKSSRVLAVSFTLGKDENRITSENTAVTLTNEGTEVADLYVFQPSADNPTLQKIRIYNPNDIKKHKVTVSLNTSDGMALGTTETEVEEGTDHVFSLAKVMEKDGAFYVLQGSEGRTDFSETCANVTADISKTYTYVKDESIVTFKKFTGSSDAKASSGAFVSFNQCVESMAEVEAGAYEAEMFIFSKKSTAVRDCSMFVDGISVAKYTDEGIKTIKLNLTAEASVQYGCTSTSSNNIDYIILRKTGEAVTTQTVSVGAEGKATFCPAYPMDFTKATNIAAYKAAVNGTTATMTKVSTVAAGEGVVLRSTGRAVEELVKVANPLAANEGNELVGVLEDTPLVQTSGNYTLFYLNATGFVKVPEAGMKLAEGKAYLPVATSIASECKMMSIVFDDSTLTGIDNTKDEFAKCNEIFYTLAGQRVAVPAKGVYVKKGKKVIF